MDIHYFEKYIESIRHADKDTFMTYISKRTTLFFLDEQKRWFDEIIYKSKKNYIFNFSFSNLNILRPETGNITLHLDITRPSGRIKHLIARHVIIKEHGKWRIGDLPFRKIDSKFSRIYYLNKNKKIALRVHKFIDHIIEFYMRKFLWKPKKIVIKIYDSLEQLSYTIPHFSIYGWNEYNESIKMAIPHYLKPIEIDRFIFNLLSHEISHSMLSELSNDNASLFLQEGFAIYMESGMKYKNHNIFFDSLALTNTVIRILKEENHLVFTIDEICNLDYLNEHLYNQSFLIVYFLISHYGIKEFCLLCEKLASFPYINRRIEHKSFETNERTFQSIESIYAFIAKDTVKQFYVDNFFINRG